MKQFVFHSIAALRTAVMGLGLCVAGTTGFAQMAVAQGATSETEPADTSKVIARVNGEPITEAVRDQIADRMIYQQLQRFGGNAANMDPAMINNLRESMHEKALEQVINMKLVEAERNKVKVSDEEINKQIKKYEDLLKEQKTTLEEYLAKMQMTESVLRQNVLVRLQMEKILEKRDGELNPTEAQMKKFYEENKEEMKRPEMVQASHILIAFPGTPGDPSAPAPTEAEKAELKKKAEMVLGKVKAGEDFTALAKEYSGDPSVKENGGDMGMQPRGKFVKPFEDAAFGLEVGQVSGVVESPFGYHIIKVTGKQAAKDLTFDEVKEPIEQKMIGDKFKTGMENLIADLRKSAKIEDLEPKTKPAADKEPMGEMPMGAKENTKPESKSDEKTETKSESKMGKKTDAKSEPKSGAKSE